jgi:hypothetical protein
MLSRRLSFFHISHYQLNRHTYLHLICFYLQCSLLFGSLCIFATYLYRKYHFIIFCSPALIASYLSFRHNLTVFIEFITAFFIFISPLAISLPIISISFIFTFFFPTQLALTTFIFELFIYLSLISFNIKAFAVRFAKYCLEIKANQE